MGIKEGEGGDGGSLYGKGVERGGEEGKRKRNGDISTGTKVPSVDFLLPGTKLQRNEKSRYHNDLCSCRSYYMEINMFYIS